ncbi:MAG: sensor histidine kinase [Chitinophagaceae bacterium]|nr:sensor histidine kinase [Chitinophagaceae bacterium]
MKKSLFPACLMLLCSVFALAQHKDSLLRVARTHQTDTLRINAYLELASAFRKDPALLQHYADTALLLSQKIDYTSGTIRAMAYQALVHQLAGEAEAAKKGYGNAISLARQTRHKNAAGLAYRNYAGLLKDERRYDEALAYNDTALKIFTGTKDSLQLETLYGNIGRIYLEKDQFSEAIKYFLTGMAAYERSGNDFGISKAYNDIGTVYERMGDNQRALASFLSMIEPAQRSGKEEQLAIAYQNIGTIYYRQMKDSLALTYIHRAYDLNKKLGRQGSLLISVFNLAGVENRLMHYPEAARLFEECIVLAREQENDYVLAASFQNAAVVYSIMKQDAKAVRYFNEALEREVALNDAQFTMLLFEDLGSFYRDRGDYKKAYDYMIIAGKLKDSLRSVDKEVAIASLQEQFETEKKERRIAELNNKSTRQQLMIRQEKDRQKILFAGLSALVLLTAGGAAFYIQRNKARQEKAQFSSVLDAEQKERMRIARDLHDSIGQMLSVVKMQLSSLPADPAAQAHLSGTQTLVDKTIQEVRHISHNLIPEELNFGLISALEDLGDKINKTEEVKVVVAIAAELNTFTFSKQFELSLYRIIQEIVSNMLKHAQAKQISISMQQRSGLLVLDISDDGKGFDPASVSEGKGLGWKNILARVSLLNGKMNIQSERIRGTQIQITLPQ